MPAKRDKTVSDWIEVADQAIKPRGAIPVTPLQLRADGLRRELLSRPDAARTMLVMESVALGARMMRKAQAQPVVDAKLAEGLKSRESVEAAWPEAVAKLRAKRQGKVQEKQIVWEVSKRTGLSEPTVRRYSPQAERKPKR